MLKATFSLAEAIFALDIDANNVFRGSGVGIDHSLSSFTSCLRLFSTLNVDKQIILFLSQRSELLALDPIGSLIFPHDCGQNLGPLRAIR